MSHPARGARIEMPTSRYGNRWALSHPAWGAWIKILVRHFPKTLDKRRDFTYTVNARWVSHGLPTLWDRCTDPRGPYFFIVREDAVPRMALFGVYPSIPPRRGDVSRGAFQGRPAPRTHPGITPPSGSGVARLSPVESIKKWPPAKRTVKCEASQPRQPSRGPISAL